MPNNGSGSSDKDLRHRALQIAAQLPSEASEARQVLCLCRELVDKFLGAENQPEVIIRLVCPARNEVPSS